MRFDRILINESQSIRQALEKLNETARKVLIVVDGHILKGVLNDGDIRRWILKNGTLDALVGQVMNRSPKYIHITDIERSMSVLDQEMIDAIPVVNSNHEVIDVIFRTELSGESGKHLPRMNLPVVIMAGGKGARLDPYTRVIPKPMIPIGDITIAERIINRFRAHGCQQFYMTVNYKKNMIKAFFGETELDYDMEFVEEDKPLGTAGGLSLLAGRIKSTFFLSNCDILIEGDYSSMLDYHRSNQNDITIISSLQNYVVPYGVLEVNESNLVTRINEKPEFNFLVNTGLYLLEPDVLKYIPVNEFYHITDLFEECISRKRKIGVYPISESSWLDMGRIKEMENMIERLGSTK